MSKKTAVILDAREGEVVIHHYDVEYVDKEFGGDVEAYLELAKLINDDCQWTVMDELHIRTEK